MNETMFFSKKDIKHISSIEFLKTLSLKEIYEEVINYPDIKLRKDVVTGIISTFNDVRDVILHIFPKKYILHGKFLYQLLIIRACELAVEEKRKYLTAKFIKRVGDIYISQLKK